MKKLFLFSLFIFYALSKLFSGAGTVSGQYLKLEADSRASALGGAYSSVSGEAMSLFYNPAGLLFSETKNVSLLYSTYFDDMNYQTGAFSMPAGKFGFGVGVSMFSYGKINGYEQDGIMPTTVQPSGSRTISGGVGYKITDKIGFGLGVKSVSETLDKQTNSGIAADAGLLFKTKKISVGAAIQNLNGKLKFDSVEEKLPQVIRLGVSVRPVDSLQVLFDVKNTDSGIGGGVGVEYNPFSLLSVRAGYSYVSKMSGLEGLTGITAGIGLNVNKFGLDISYSPTGELGNAIRAALSFKFGGGGNGKNLSPENVPEARDSEYQNSPAAIKEREAVKSVEKTAELEKEEAALKTTEAAAEPAKEKISSMKKTMPIEEKKKIFMNAMEFYKAGEYKKAIAEWQKILEADPSHQSSLEYIKKANDNLIKK